MKYMAIILLLLVIPNASAAIIQGRIYDLELNRVDNVMVEINTVPAQRVISKYGEYFFNVPYGDYTITTTAMLDGEDYVVMENVSIISDGEFSLDLFLFPEIENLEEFPNIEDDNNTLKYIIVGIIFFGLIFLLYKLHRKEEFYADDDGELNKIYSLIKSRRRITQREIRKNSLLSESKISLIITQLEKEGKIKKIKKGRGNIIILNKS
ncbi:hypothetical protein J4425_01875 [Candidatus Woesearchaeota archaeon]|nr:hypothetical protein [Candidatus Woesearchaeota archaeon]